MEINSSKKARYREMSGIGENMEEIRTNLSKEDVVHNMLEIAFYLAQQGKDVNEIDVKVKDLNMHFEAWMDATESEE